MLGSSAWAGMLNRNKRLKVNRMRDISKTIARKAQWSKQRTKNPLRFQMGFFV
jgi:hypothetical protein